MVIFNVFWKQGLDFFDKIFKKSLFIIEKSTILIVIS